MAFEVRVQVVNIRSCAPAWGKPGDIYVGRPSPWGNPFIIGKHGDRGQAIERYRAWLMKRPWLIEQLRSARPVRLGCWCAPAACHGDVLAEAING